MSDPASLLRQGPVVRAVLQGLPLRELSRLSLVSRAFRREASGLLRGRRSAQTFAFNAPDQQALEGRLHEELSSRLLIRPSLLLGLALTERRPASEPVDGGAKALEEVLRRCVPPETELLLSCATAEPTFDRGLLGTSGTSGQLRGEEWERAGRPCVALVALPSLDPSVRLRRLHSTPAGLEDAVTAAAELRGLFLLLHEDHEANGLDYVGQDLADVCEERSVPVLGGLLGSPLQSVASVKAYWEAVVRDQLSSHNTAFLVEGQGALSVSVLLGKAVRSQTAARGHFEAGRRELSGRLGGWEGGAFVSLALCAVCCARGKALHRKSGVESRLFLSVFPKTPLIGFFTIGELGHDSDGRFAAMGYSSAFLILVLPVQR